MRNNLLLAWRYLRHTPVRSLLVSGAVALTLLLPITVQVLVDEYGRGLVQRAQDTPLVAGAPGSRYDLVLSSLYFSGRTPDVTSMAEVERIAAEDLSLTIPLLARATAAGAPLVGASHDYFEFRELRAASGSLPLRLGDTVLGSALARRLGLGPGDHLLSDQRNLYDLSRAYPLRMRVTGVLEETGGPDDATAFVSLETAWVVEGIGHGHQAAEEARDDVLLDRDEEGVVFSPAVVEYTEITDANIDSFHLHAPAEELPVTAILVVPHDARSSTMVKARFRVWESMQLLVPLEVVEELLGFVLRLKLFLDANALLVGGATLLFLTVLVLLALEARRGEMRTLGRLGCARGTVARLFLTELLLLLLGGLALAAMTAAGLWALAPDLSELLRGPAS